MILLEGPDRATLRAMGDAVVPELLALGPDVVSSAEDGTQQARAFLTPRAGLFLERTELEQAPRRRLRALGLRGRQGGGRAARRQRPAGDRRGHREALQEERQGGQLGRRRPAPTATTSARTARRSSSSRARPSPAATSRRPARRSSGSARAVEGVRRPARSSRPSVSATPGTCRQGFIEYDRIRNDLLSVGRERHRPRSGGRAALLHAPARAARDGHHHRRGARVDASASRSSSSATSTSRRASSSASSPATGSTSASCFALRVCPSSRTPRKRRS